MSVTCCPQMSATFKTSLLLLVVFTVFPPQHWSLGDVLPITWSGLPLHCSHAAQGRCENHASKFVKQQPKNLKAPPEVSVSTLQCSLWWVVIRAGILASHSLSLNRRDFSSSHGHTAADAVAGAQSCSEVVCEDGGGGGTVICRLNSTKKMVVVTMQAENEVCSAFWTYGHMRNKSPKPRCVPLVWNRAGSITSFFSLGCLNVECVYWLHSQYLNTYLKNWRELY